MDIIAKKQEKLQNFIDSAKQFDEKTENIKKDLESLIDFCDKDFGDKSLNAISKQYARRASLVWKALTGKMRNVNGGAE